MPWSDEQFKELCRRRGVDPEKALAQGYVDLDPNLKPRKAKVIVTQLRKAYYENSVRAGLQEPVAKPNTPMALVEKAWRGHQVPESPHPRFRVSVTGYRRTCIDPDNYTGGIKALVDCLQCAGLIPADDWETISLETKQVRVTTPRQERTLVEIEFPD